MSFVLNGCQQISLFDSLGFLSERKQRILDKSWAKTFSKHIFTKIDEMIFAPLYSDKRNSRPNAPVNVIVGALIIKELNGLSDDKSLRNASLISDTSMHSIPQALRISHSVTAHSAGSGRGTPHTSSPPVEILSTNVSVLCPKR